MALKMQMSLKMHIVALLVAISALIIVIFYASQPKPIREINLVFPENSWSYAIQWSMENKLVGIPDNVKVQVLATTPSNDMFIFGKADIGAVMLPSFLMAWNMSKDWRIVGLYGATYNYLCAPKNSNIISPYDLKGKKMAVVEMRAFTTVIVSHILETKYNISRNEITFIAKPQTVIPVLLEKNEVDVGIVIGRMVPDAHKRFKVLFEIEQEYASIYGYRSIPTVFVAKKDLDKRIVENITKTLNKALEIAYNNIDALGEWSYKKYGTNMTDIFMVDKKFMTSQKEGEYLLIVPWDEVKKSILQQEFMIIKQYDIVKEIPNIEEVLYGN